MTLCAPGKIRVFLDGNEVNVDRRNGTAQINVDAAPEKPSTLLAYEPSENELVGRWVELPWQTPREQRSWYVSRHIIDDVSADGPVRMTRPGYGFWSHVGGTGMLQGAFPKAKKIRLQGGWGMREESQFDPGDAVIRIDGKEVLRLPGGSRPYEVKTFEVDVTQHAGQPVFLEFTVEGTVHGAMMSDWFNPQIIVER